jgi:hypothetical protein
MIIFSSEKMKVAGSRSAKYFSWSETSAPARVARLRLCSSSTQTSSETQSPGRYPRVWIWASRSVSYGLRASEWSRAQIRAQAAGLARATGVGVAVRSISFVLDLLTFLPLPALQGAVKPSYTRTAGKTSS